MKDELMTKVIELVAPFAKNKEALAAARPESTFLQDLEVSSSRLVDIVLAIEDTFGIEVGDTEADGIVTLGSAVSLIEAKRAAA